MKYTTKTWTYVLPSIKGEGYAYIFLTNTGVFSAVSDFDNYGYIWSNTGFVDVREFFLKSDPAYFLEKLAPAQEFDDVQTLENARLLFERLVADGTWDADDARRAFDTITDEFNSFDSAADVASWASSLDGLEGLNEPAQMKIMDALHGGEISSLRRSRMAERFVKEVLPRLASAIKSELAAERLHVVADSQA